MKCFFVFVLFCCSVSTGTNAWIDTDLLQYAIKALYVYKNKKQGHTIKTKTPCLTSGHMQQAFLPTGFYFYSECTPSHHGDAFWSLSTGPIRCIFVNTEETPMLLGRMDPICSGDPAYLFSEGSHEKLDIVVSALKKIIKRKQFPLKSVDVYKAQRETHLSFSSTLSLALPHFQSPFLPLSFPYFLKFILPSNPNRNLEAGTRV